MFLLEINVFRMVFSYPLQIKAKTFVLEIHFSKMSILPIFEISITEPKTVWRL